MANPIALAAALAGTRTVTCAHCGYRKLVTRAPRRCAKCGQRLAHQTIRKQTGR